MNVTVDYNHHDFSNVTHIQRTFLKLYACVILQTQPEWQTNRTQ